MRRLTYILLVAVLLATVLPNTIAASSQVRLIVDNSEVFGLDSPPLILNNRVMVPARAVFERVGGSVQWNGESRAITVLYGEDVLVMTIGQTVATLNGEPITMEVAPVILGDRTLIPLRFPAEAFGFDVAWDHVGRAAILHSPLEDDMDDEYMDGHTVDPTPPPLPEGPNLARDISTSPIMHVPHIGTNILSLLSPSQTGADAYSIIASSPISDVNHFLLPDNRLVVDIYNAVSSLSGPFIVDGPVREIRSSQFSTNPNITRVVFDIIGPVEFSLALSYDRTTLTVAFSVNTISDVRASSNLHSDTIVIQGDFQPSIRLSSSGHPDYLLVYIDNANMDALGGEMPDGNFTSRFTTGQTAEGVAFVRIYIRNEWPAISILHSNDSVSLALHQGLSGVYYDFAARELRISKEILSIDVNQVQYTEEYLLNRYTLTLPSGASGLGFGTLYIGDGFINTVNVGQNATGNTTIVFDTTRVLAFTVRETETEYVIRANLPREIYSQIVIIDPGHGGRDPGTSHHGVVEKDVVLAISHMIMNHINQNPNIRAYMTRHGDVTVANSWRAEFANQIGADLYVSVHANAATNRPTVSGIETWYMNHSRENNLGFSSRELARIIQYRKITATGAIDRGLRTRGDLIVLRDTNMPAVLLEVGFISNPEEAARLASSSHQQVLARAIYEGIVESFNAHPGRR